MKNLSKSWKSFENSLKKWRVPWRKYFSDKWRRKFSQFYKENAVISQLSIFKHTKTHTIYRNCQIKNLEISSKNTTFTVWSSRFLLTPWIWIILSDHVIRFWQFFCLEWCGQYHNLCQEVSKFPKVCAKNRSLTSPPK